MDAVKYFKEKRRLLDSLGRTGGHCEGVTCEKCPLSVTNNKKKTHCKALEIEHPETAVEIVEKWSAENPQKTILQDFLEKYPKAQLCDDGTPNVCPKDLGISNMCVSLNDCHDCWNRPLEG